MSEKYWKPTVHSMKRRSFTHDYSGYGCDAVGAVWIPAVDKAAVLRSPRKTAALKPFAIPEGRYPLVVTWSPKFKEWLPLLLHVRGFEGIRIHAGNTAADTQGCILVGENRRKGQVLDSRRTLSLLKRMLAHRPLGEAVYITVE